jgi:hypothetical protein
MQPYVAAVFCWVGLRRREKVLYDLHTISEDEMVTVFLQTEMASPRFESRILAILQHDGRDRHVIDQPHLDDAEENAYRALVLGEHRGYRRDADVFTGMPSNVRWFRARLTREDLAQVRYIDYDYWTELSGGTRRVADGAARVRRGLEAFGVGNGAYWYLADALHAGATFPEPILVGTDERSPLVVLEGHVRMTAYLLRPEYLPATLPILVGLSPQMDK